MVKTLEDVPYPEASTGILTIDGALRFGPTHEVTLASSPEFKDCFLNPATGQVLSASDELIDGLKARGRLGKFPVLDTWEWTEQQGVDLMMWKGDLILIDPCEKRISVSIDDPFNALSPQYVNFLAQPFLKQRSGSGQKGTEGQLIALHMLVTRRGQIVLLEVMTRDRASGQAKLRFKRIERVGPETSVQSLDSSTSGTGDVDAKPVLGYL